MRLPPLNYVQHSNPWPTVRPGFRWPKSSVLPCVPMAYANIISEGGALRPETLYEHITILPKPWQDPSLCGSYRPIALLNIDAKVLATILLHLIPQWVSRDQTGFILGREACDNS